MRSSRNKKSKSEVRTKKQRVFEDKLSAWASGKAELTDLQRQAYKKKVDLEIKLKKEEHNMKMKFKQQLYKARVKMIMEKLEFKKKQEMELKLLSTSSGY